MEYKATILKIDFVTHDVKRFILTRPEGLDVAPGQGVDLAIDDDEWRNEKRAFTPISLAGDGVLEFVIKAYPQHHGVTSKLHEAKPGTSILLSEPFGTISYQGVGTFIAAGAGITPFLAILANLADEERIAGNRLLFFNKSHQDIIYQKALIEWLGNDVQFFCSREADCHCESGRVDKALLEQYVTDFKQNFYVCGPQPFTDATNAALHTLGAEPASVVFER